MWTVCGVPSVLLVNDVVLVKGGGEADMGAVDPEIMAIPAS